jgi:hypothetical protein
MLCSSLLIRIAIVILNSYDDPWTMFLMHQKNNHKVVVLYNPFMFG